MLLLDTNKYSKNTKGGLEMIKLFEKYNITIKRENLPENILSYYVCIGSTSYLLLNRNLTNHQELVAYEMLTYYFLTGKTSGIFTSDQYNKKSYPSTEFYSGSKFKLSAIS